MCVCPMVWAEVGLGVVIAVTSCPGRQSKQKHQQEVTDSRGNVQFDRREQTSSPACGFASLWESLPYISSTFGGNSCGPLPRIHTPGNVKYMDVS